MTTQPELEFGRLEGKGPEVEKFQVDEMIAALRGRDWRTAADLGARKEKDKRMLRAIAEESEGQIISGQKGYKLTLESTPEEVRSAGGCRFSGCITGPFNRGNEFGVFPCLALLAPQMG